jgi:hypothetical protein
MNNEQLTDIEIQADREARHAYREMLEGSPEKYTMTYEGPNGVKVTREFSTEDLYEVAYHTLKFIRGCGFDYVDMLEMSTPKGSIYRAETL